MVVLTTGVYAPLSGYWEWNFANSPGFVFAPAGFGVSVGRGAASLPTFIGFHVTAVGCLVGLRAAADRKVGGDGELQTAGGAAVGSRSRSSR